MYRFTIALLLIAGPCQQLVAQPRDICAVVGELIDEATAGFPNTRGELRNQVGSFQYRCSLPIPGSTTCRIRMSKNPKNADYEIVHGWNTPTQAAALEIAESLAESVANCELGEYEAPFDDDDSPEREWIVHVDGGLETEDLEEAVTIRVATKYNQLPKDYSALMTVNFTRITYIWAD